jgi:peptide-methionine (S)-S-oxide reductase
MQLARAAAHPKEGMLMRMLLFLTALALPAADFPNPVVDAPRAAARGRQTAVLAGGCFWCTEAVFENLAGVEKVVSGYSGGSAASAKYKIVSAGATTHAEAIEITYDPSRLTYGQVLKIFFSIAHDPTQLDRQGPDWGKQYRSAIFYSDEEQKKIAEAYIQQLTEAKAFSKPIVTQVVPLKGFFPAEDYHQDYVANNPDNPYVQANAIPKINKLKKADPEAVKK